MPNTFWLWSILSDKLLQLRFSHVANLMALVFHAHMLYANNSVNYGWVLKS